ncbi:MAG: SDR family oxidoreductase [Gammaproteobacteria bacterium]|nr:SDR family oxidoreductase [Gammaproteobacteria bacterium]MCP4090520.1 SDR family oxidoreductase [Gammaproteobacteria bacterium]MCP4276615.1 SDR family oxidoreductase [Gammaproteobacteria bacterium]MCP4831319.1 SDR family oxidoreductase [Gammaproteobacteria bacterium]MCP4927909.1 SDR family oxidoreductase [Gammaproteobacteria bacterium]
MPTVLITGTNRGLGLEFTRQYIDLGWHVIAFTRKPHTAELQELNQEQLHICQLDVVDHAAIDRLAEELAEITLDVLINNAGTTGPKGAPECIEYSGVDNTDYDIWREVFEINVLGAFKIATAFHPHLAKAERGVLVNMSSDLGSMTQNTMGNMYSYRSSKSALNMLTAGFANDWKDIISVSMAPGWCRTELGGAGAEIDPAESVTDQIKSISKLTAEQSGCFIDRFGKPVAW